MEDVGSPTIAAESPPPAKRPPLSIGEMLLGVLTFWPLAYIFIFIAFIVSTVATNGQSASGSFGVLMCVHLGTMLDMLAMTVYYGVAVYREAALQGDRKLLWMVIVLLAGILGQAAYYVLWVVRRDPIVTGSAPVTPTGPSGAVGLSAYTCPACGRPYDPAEYRSDAAAHCVECGERLPLGRA